MFDDFLIRAFVAGIGLAIITGPLGCFIVWRRLSYFGDTLAHSALLGVVIAYALSFNIVLSVFVISGIISLSLLYSSVSESVTSLTKNVKKIPLNKNCIKQPYNITEPQPQLFVTKDFKKLKTILIEYSKTMAFKTGGEQALEKAILSKHITTTVMDSGLQISGVLEKCILNKRQELAYMTYNGGTQLSFKDCQLEGHSKEFHSEGYGCATGKVSSNSLKFFAWSFMSASLFKFIASLP